MDTNYIRDLLRRGAQNWTEMAVDYIVDAIDELDERTRPGGAKVVYERSPEVGVDEPSTSWTEKDTAPAPTIPGCYCRECRYSKWAPEYKCWSCIHAGSPAFAVVSVPVGFGCTLGERQETE